MNTQEVEITKSARGWSIHTTQQWENATHPVHDYSGTGSSLAWAIYITVDWAARNRTRIVSFTVHGEPYPREKILAAIKKASKGGLEYARKIVKAVFTLKQEEAQR